MTTIQKISPRQAQRAKQKEERQRQALVHMNNRIKDLEVKCINSGGSLFEKQKMRESIDFLTKVRDTTIYNVEVSLGNKPRRPKHQRVMTQVEHALAVDASFANLGSEPQPDMSFMIR